MSSTRPYRLPWSEPRSLNIAVQDNSTLFCGTTPVLTFTGKHGEHLGQQRGHNPEGAGQTGYRVEFRSPM